MTGTGPASVATFRNAQGRSEIYGAEFSGIWVTGNLSVDFGIGLLESELGTFRNVVDPFTLETVDLTGASSPFSPDVTASIGIEYVFRLGAVDLRPRVDYAHIGDTQAGLWDSELITLDDRDLLNVQFAITPAAGRWYANLWMTNATDERFAGGIQNNGSLRYAAPPRQYGLRVGMTFE